MSDSVTTVPRAISSKTRAIVCFGPATATSGFRSGEYFQVTIDPAMASPGGDYIRFDQRHPEDENEIHGWQRVDALTICEVLHVANKGCGESITMREIVKG